MAGEEHTRLGSSCPEFSVKLSRAFLNQRLGRGSDAGFVERVMRSMGIGGVKDRRYLGRVGFIGGFRVTDIGA